MASCESERYITFDLVSMVLLFPLGGENVEISWLFKKTKITRRDSRRKNSFKLTTTRKLIFHLNQNPNIIWCQDIQHRCIEVLWPKEQEERQCDSVSQTLKQAAGVGNRALGCEGSRTPTELPQLPHLRCARSSPYLFLNPMG